MQFEMNVCKKLAQFALLWICFENQKSARQKCEDYNSF